MGSRSIVRALKESVDPASLTFAWRKGYGAPIDASAAGSALLAIWRQSGDVGSADVVDAASDPTNPLHEFFEWRDDRAANDYRLDQAWDLVHAIRVVTTDDMPALEPRRIAVQSLDAPEPQAIVAVVPMTADKEQARGFEAIARWRFAYRHVPTFQPIFDAIDRVAAALEGKPVLSEHAEIMQLRTTVKQLEKRLIQNTMGGHAPFTHDWVKEHLGKFYCCSRCKLRTTEPHEVTMACDKGYKLHEGRGRPAKENKSA